MDYKRVNKAPYGAKGASCQMRYSGVASAKTVMNYAAKTPMPEKQLAMVYAPYQNFEDLYAVDKGFYTGTIFAQLDLPCTACTCCRMNKQGGMRYE